MSVLLAALASHAGAQAPEAPRRSAGDVMQALQQKYKQNEGKFDDLARRMEKAVLAAIDDTAWLGAGEGARSFVQHPSFTFIRGLAEAARKDAKQRNRNSPETQALLARHPWDKDLELIHGLAYGSDRAIPDHENGFIELGTAATFPGFPDLPVNVYLYGLDEIVGWQYRTKVGKKLAFEGRTSKDPVLMATDLESWDEVHGYLLGTMPEVPLYAVPWLTHCLHARLAERRRADAGQAGEPAASMDEMLALMDSVWNGYCFQTPWSRERSAIVAPLLELYADRKGFVFQFPPSARLEGVGDLPFISVETLQRYAKAILGQNIDTDDFILPTAEATAASNQFQASCTYLARYKSLVDEIVRAIVAPSSRFPAYLQNSDFRGGHGPDTRQASGRFECPRKYAVLLWAWSNKDPVKLADFLYDNILSKEAHRFPGDSVLQHELTAVVSRCQSDLLKSIADRIAADRGEGNAPGDFEREFSPYPAYLTTDGSPHADFLLCSFQSFHEGAAAVVREAAFAVALQEVE